MDRSVIPNIFVVLKIAPWYILTTINVEYGWILPICVMASRLWCNFKELIMIHVIPCHSGESPWNWKENNSRERNLCSGTLLSSKNTSYSQAHLNIGRNPNVSLTWLIYVCSDSRVTVQGVMIILSLKLHQELNGMTHIGIK